MLQFAENWTWITKTLIAVILWAPMATLVVFFNKRFGLSSEAYYFAWIIGVTAAFVGFVGMSPTASLQQFVQPIVPFLAVVLLGVVFGGAANIFQAQAVRAAPNPSLPSAIGSINVPLAYLIAYSVSRVSPNNFPLIKFSWINFGGTIVLVVGLAMVIYKSK